MTRALVCAFGAGWSACGAMWVLPLNAHPAWVLAYALLACVFVRDMRQALAKAVEAADVEVSSDRAVIERPDGGHQT